MTILHNLAQAINLIEHAAQELSATPETSSVAELVTACEQIDVYYKQMCDDLDDNDGDEIGTTYENGVSIEFYIEADWWHDVSVQLRKLRELKAK